MMVCAPFNPRTGCAVAPEPPPPEKETVGNAVYAPPNETFTDMTVSGPVRVVPFQSNSPLAGSAMSRRSPRQGAAVTSCVENRNPPPVISVRV